MICHCRGWPWQESRCQCRVRLSIMIAAAAPRRRTQQASTKAAEEDDIGWAAGKPASEACDQPLH